MAVRPALCSQVQQCQISSLNFVRVEVEPIQPTHTVAESIAIPGDKLLPSPFPKTIVTVDGNAKNGDKFAFWATILVAFRQLQSLVWTRLKTVTSTCALYCVTAGKSSDTDPVSHS